MNLKYHSSVCGHQQPECHIFSLSKTAMEAAYTRLPGKFSWVNVKKC